MTGTDKTFGPVVPDGASLLFAPDEIRHAVDRLGLAVRETYGRDELTVVVVLKGALVFAADLIRRLDMPVTLRTLTARSYHGDATCPGALDVSVADLGDLAGRDVLLVDDILDTGRTLHALLAELRSRRPASLRSIVLLDKPSRREVPVEADFVGLPVEDRFIVGYGLDHAGLYRNLAGLFALDAPAEERAPAQSASTSIGSGSATKSRQPSAEEGV